MDFSQVAVEFRKLKARYDAGALSEAEFKTRLQDLMLQDEQGRWWMIGYETGQWYVHDGEKWVRAKPPIPGGQPTVITAPLEMPPVVQKGPEKSVLRPQAQPPRPWLRIGGGIVAAIVVIAVIAVIALLAGSPRSTPTPTPAPRATEPPRTLSAPTRQSTVTPVPPTITSAPPTATPRPPTATPVPPTFTATTAPPTPTRPVIVLELVPIPATSKEQEIIVGSLRNSAHVNADPPIVCTTCHDADAASSPFQLRVVGKPEGLPFEIKKDVGLSAGCYVCHNAQSRPADAGDDSYPSGTAAAEFLSDTGSVTYGQILPNSPHGMMIGIAPIPNPAYTITNTPGAQFMYSAPGDKKGNIPGPCVVCHMVGGIGDAKDPNYMKVGGHSFNTVSPDDKFDYGASCTTCHGALGDVTDFNMKAKADYDGNGKVEGVQDEVKGLLNVLWKGLEAKGVKKVDTGYPYATLPRGTDGKVDSKINNAWFNFRLVYGVMWGITAGNEGKAAAMHNFKRSVALLQLSIRDLTGSLPTGGTEMK